MASTLDSSTKALLQKFAEQLPAAELPFIVTLVAGARAAEVVPFAPAAEAEVIRMVAGRMTARQALTLATHTQVATIEFDGEARALELMLVNR